MTTPYPEAPDATTTGNLRPSRGLPAPRLLAAWALVGYVALFLFFEFFELVLPGGTLFTRAAGADFRSLFVMAMPVLAVLLAVHVAPVLRGARLLTTVALVEYALALFFGAVTLLIGLGAVFGGIDSPQSAFGALRYLVMGAAELALITIAGLVAYRAFTGLGGALPGRN